MKRTLLVCLSLLFLLSGCGQRPQPDLEHFQGEVVATLQKPISEVTPEPLATVFAPSEEAGVTPEASLPVPTDALGSTPTPTESNPQTTSYPVGTGTPTLITQTTATANLTQVPTANLTVVPTANLIPAPTTTFGVPVWEGVWKIWYQSTSGGYIPAELTLEVSDGRVTGTAKIDGLDFTFKGDVSIDGTQAEGEWKTGSNKGRFWWRMNSADTFVGSRENRFGFCGNRTTAAQPNPCREVPQN